MSQAALFFVYVWPEPASSAAGVRTRELMRALQAAGWKVSAVSPGGTSRFSEELNALGIETYTCDPNLSPATDSALGALPAPALVVYDRFVMEEQFGWRARSLWPSAVHIVDTQDLHCVRRAREKLAHAGASWEKIKKPTTAELGEDLLRELSSLYRADAALVVSSWEKELLESFTFPTQSLLHLPFPAETDAQPPPFLERSGFCFLGNFRHAPNLDSVRWLLGEPWPALRQKMPNAELHLYGSYPPSEISQHKGKNGIYAHGPVADHRAALRKHRALLAPLRFGAGIKGKVLESWGTGTPVLGSPLTFEGMLAEGLVANDEKSFVTAALALHEEGELWARQSELGKVALRATYEPNTLAENFLTFIAKNQQNLFANRESNLTGAMLRHHQSNSTKYFSRWIEAKNAKNGGGS